jgi:hypothetical protein
LILSSRGALVSARVLTPIFPVPYAILAWNTG